MLEARKILYFICALIILLSTLLPDLILIKSEVFAATDEITTEKIENEDESTVTNEIETNDKTSQKVIMPIDISKFSLGEKVAILINNNNEIKVVPTSYSNIEKLCDEETTVYFGIIVENGIEIEVEKTDDKILEYTNKSKEELSKIIQIVSKEELEETDENKKAMMSINEDNGIMPISALSGITGLNTSAKFGVCEGSYARFGHEMHYMTTGGVTSLVFCMEYSKTSPTGKEYYYGSDYTTRVEETLKELSLLIYFGHTAKYGTGVPTSDEAWKTAIAAQQMCWSVSSTEFDTKYPLSGIWKSEWLTKSSLDLFLFVK